MRKIRGLSEAVRTLDGQGRQILLTFAEQFAQNRCPLTAANFVRALRTHVSTPLAEAAGLDRPSRAWSKPLLLDLFRDIQRDPRLSPELCDEAREVDAALNMAIGRPARLTAVRDAQPSPTDARFRPDWVEIPLVPGSVCRYCWRTTLDLRFHHGIYGVCANHEFLPIPDSTTSAADRDAFKRNRRNREFVQRVIRAAPPDAVYRVRISPGDVVILPKRICRLVPDYDGAREPWRSWVQNHFRLTFELLEKDKRQLADPASTVEALEGRLLIEEEKVLYAEPSNLSAPLMRCENWQILIQRSRIVTGRRPRD